jgi:hypothetical protein
MQTPDSKLSDELRSFSQLWKGGYFEGDPLDPLATSTYAEFGFISVLHATYLKCIKPYITPRTVALEIGPGRGAFTRTLIGASEVWALDALSAEHNGFWGYVGEHPHVHYYQVEDFSCSMLPENHFDYMFSFGCFCHVSFDGITQYAINLAPKLKSGAECFWMIADYEKFNATVTDLSRNSIFTRLLPGSRFAPLRAAWRWLARVNDPQQPKPADSDDLPRAEGRWYDAGTDRTCAMLESIGYEIVERDVGTLLRDPIIHFRKP